ncbi:MAG: MBL fold metallo-hydrolase [Ruminococcaceae bacterium]|nr:MBL fold metallo-hydrolase [Oscillospiraceae bacterium]
MIEKISINEHSSIRIEGEPVLYFDPFRIQKETNDADIVFITHAHYDHFSPEDIKKISCDKTVFVMPKSMEREVGEYGFTKENAVFMEAGDETSVQGVLVKAVPSYNVDKPMHPKENGWLGYIITIDGAKIYVSGDCDAMPEEISCDIAMIPIGGTYTMNPKESAEWVNQMKPKVVIPTHYGTLVGTPEDFCAFEPLVKDIVRVIKILP